MGAVHGDRVAVGDVLAYVVAVEGDAGAVIEAFGGDPVGRRVNPGDAPAVAVAYRVWLRRLVDGAVYRDGGVVSAADDEVADGDSMPTGRRPWARRRRWCRGGCAG